MRRLANNTILKQFVVNQNRSYSSSSSKPIVTLFGGDADNPLAFHVLNQISNQCSKIKIQTNNAQATKTALNKYLQNVDQSKYEIIEAKTTDDQQVASAVYGSNAVINVDRLLIEDERSYLDVYVNGVGTIAHNSEKFGVEKLIHTSVMGADLDHESRFLDVNYRAEDIAYGEFPDVTILRPNFATFGDREAIVESFRKKLPLKLSPIIPYPGRAGTLKIQPVHIEDVAKAISKSVLEADVNGKVLQLGGANTYTFPQFLRKVFGPKLFLPVPAGVTHAIYSFTQFLPGAIVSRDHVPMICMNNQDEEHVQLLDMTEDQCLPVDPSQRERFGTFKDLNITPAGF